MSKLRIESASLAAVIHENGQIQRTDMPFSPSESWVCTGMVDVRFGRHGTFWTLAEALAGKVPFTYKNGNQRVFLRCWDHGITKFMMSPRMRFQVVP